MEKSKLPEEFIQKLKEIVGSEWVSEDRAVVETYSFLTVDTGNALRKCLRDPSIIPACVVLPSTTEEVQAIVKLCNQHKIPFIAFTNGQSASATNRLGTLLIHLSRMDKILYVDEESMLMTIQPYVDYATIQAEARRRGLWNGGTGWHSAIAKPCSHFNTAGLWQTDLKYGGLARNIVGLKAVLPSGEILKIGSSALTTTGEYPFTERFPGPNLLGLFGKCIGTRGIITELTIKLHPWVGGSDLPEDTGNPSIAYYFEEAKKKKFDNPPPPKNYKVYWFEYPDIESLTKAVRKIARSGIGIGLNVCGFYNACMCSRTLAEAEERVREGFFPPYSGYIVLAGITSKKQLEYEEKVLKKIIEETGGRFWSKNFRAEQLEAVAPWNVEFAVNTVTGMRTVRSGYLPAMLSPYSDFKVIRDTQEMWCEALEKIGAASIFSSMGCKCPYVYVVDRGHQAVTEVDQFTKRIPESFKGIIMNLSCIAYSWAWFLKRGYYGSWYAPLGEPLVSAFPETGPNLYVLYRKIRKIMDPNNLMSSERLIWTEEEFNTEVKRKSKTLQVFSKMRKENELKPLLDST